MRRIKLIVAYDGTEYSGWQIQPEAPTIEMYLDKAIRELTGETGGGPSGSYDWLWPYRRRCACIWKCSCI